MGISDFGEMTRLSQIAQPTICVLTIIGCCHLENLGDRDGVLKAKTEMFDYMQPDAKIILNGDDDKLITVKEVKGVTPKYFGLSTKCDANADNIQSLSLKGTSCEINLGDKSFSATIKLPGHHMVYIFENGKGLRVDMAAYESKTRRKKITGAYSTDSPLAGAVYEGKEPKLIFIRSDGGRAMLIKSSLIPVKSTRTAAGTQVMQLPKKGVKVDLVTDLIESVGDDASKCKKNAIPSNGTSISQLSFKF
jgi:UDP-N-acetylmuramoyl-tripeptide--D-alanyl-D-alanine ligase